MPTMTITTDAAQAGRMAKEVGRVLGLNDAGVPRSATAAEVKAFWIMEMRRFVQRNEREDRISAISDDPFDPT